MAPTKGPWLGIEPTGDHLVWRNVIFFPWDPERRLFTGERVYSFFPALEDDVQTRGEPRGQPATTLRIAIRHRRQTTSYRSTGARSRAPRQNWTTPPPVAR